MSTHQINVEFYWPQKLDKSEQLQQKIDLSLAKHPEWSPVQQMTYALECLKERQFCIFTYGDQLDYLQFAREATGLEFSFPYSVTLGRRAHQVDRVDLILRDHGFRSTPLFWLLFLNNERYMQIEYKNYYECNDLAAYFGHKHERFAAQIAVELASSIFRTPADAMPRITAGSWE